MVMVGAQDGPRVAGARSRRRSRQAAGRVRSVRFGLTEEEFDEVGAAAAESPIRQALTELTRAAGLVRRIGVNLNQAVAKLNATGQRSADLLPYAAESLRRAERLDAVAEAVRRRLR